MWTGFCLEPHESRAHRQPSSLRSILILSSRGQTAWDLWWTKRQCDRFLSEYTFFSCHCHPTSAPYSLVCFCCDHHSTSAPYSQIHLNDTVCPGVHSNLCSSILRDNILYAFLMSHAYCMSYQWHPPSFDHTVSYNRKTNYKMEGMPYSLHMWQRY